MSVLRTGIGSQVGIGVFGGGAMPFPLLLPPPLLPSRADTAAKASLTSGGIDSIRSSGGAANLLLAVLGLGIGPKLSARPTACANDENVSTRDKGVEPFVELELLALVHPM